MVDVLFLCIQNEKRSRTAEDLFSQEYPNHIFDSAWLSKRETTKAWTTYAQERMLEKAEIIYVMTQDNKKGIEEYLINTKQYTLHQEVKNKLYVIWIPDEYSYWSEELIAILKNKFWSIFSEESLKEIHKKSKVAFKKVNGI